LSPKPEAPCETGEGLTSSDDERGSDAETEEEGKDGIEDDEGKGKGDVEVYRPGTRTRDGQIEVRSKGGEGREGREQVRSTWSFAWSLTSV
jgi:hypothetical protein